MSGEKQKNPQQIETFPPEESGFGQFFEKWCQLQTANPDSIRDQVRESVEGIIQDEDLIRAGFNHGIKALFKGTRTKDWGNFLDNLMCGKKPLRKNLKIQSLKKALEKLKKKGDIEGLSDKELEMVEKIRSAVATNFEYDSYGECGEMTSFPSCILENQKADCVGQGAIMLAFLRELGIKVLNITTNRHFLLFVITSDNRLYSLDLGNNRHGVIPEIKDSDFEEGNVAEIIDFATRKEEQTYSFKLNIKDWFGSSLEGEFKAFDGETGLIYAQMNNLGLSREAGPEGTIEAFRQNMDLVPEHPYAISGLTGALRAAKRYEEAEEAGKETIRRFPHLSMGYFNLARVYRETKRLEEAIPLHSRAMELDPETPLNVLELGITYEKMGDNDKALECYKQALATISRKNSASYTTTKRELEQAISRLEKITTKE